MTGAHEEGIHPVCGLVAGGSRLFQMIRTIRTIRAIAGAGGLCRTAAGWALHPVLFASLAGAQPAGGIYEIRSGRYTECCGIAGPLLTLLPESRQASVHLAFDPAGARLTFLGQDLETVFSIPPLSPRPGFVYALSNGMVFPDRIEFRGQGPSPVQLSGQTFLDYTVSNLADGLRINGTLVLPCLFCADVPTQFKHTNVVAVWLPPPPVIEDVQREGDLLRFRFTGEPPYDYFVEFTDSLPSTGWLSLTNFRAKLATIEAVVTDPLTNRPARFYRIRKEDCFCD